VVAGRSEGRDLVAVHVVRGDGLAGANPELLARQRQLTEELGGTFTPWLATIRLLQFRVRPLGQRTRVVVGESRRSRISTAIRPSTADLVVRDSGEIDEQVVTHANVSRFILGRLPRLHRRRERVIAGAFWRSCCDHPQPVSRFESEQH